MANGLSHVIPAKAGIFFVDGAAPKKIPAFAGMTGLADEVGWADGVAGLATSYDQCP